MIDRRKKKKPAGRPGRPLPDDGIALFSEILKVLANPTRLRLVNILACGERTVTELCELSGMKQSLVSQQLKMLRLSGIVECRKAVPRVYYSLKEKKVVDILECLRSCEGCRGGIR